MKICIELIKIDKKNYQRNVKGKYYRGKIYLKPD